MDTQLKNKIEDILNGKVSVEQAQRYLSQITEEDIRANEWIYNLARQLKKKIKQIAGTKNW